MMQLALGICKSAFSVGMCKRTSIYYMIVLPS